VNNRTHNGRGYYCGRCDGGSNCNRVITAPTAVVAATAVVVIVDVNIDVTVHVDVRVPIYVGVAIDVGLRSAAITLGGERRSRQQDGDGDEGGNWTESLHTVSLLLVLLTDLAIDLCDGDAVSIRRRIEGESVLAKGGRQVPVHDLAVLRLCVISESSDDQLSWKGKLS
jgi:hypothetical protein